MATNTDSNRRDSGKTANAHHQQESSLPIPNALSISNNTLSVTHAKSGSFIQSPKSYSEQIIRKLKLGLLYLLHEESPYWAREQQVDDFNARMNTILPEDGTISGNENDSKEEEKASSNNKNKFGLRCREFNYTIDLVGKDINKVKNLVNKLWSDNQHDINEMDQMHEFWDEWYDYDAEYDWESDYDPHGFGDHVPTTLKEQTSAITNKYTFKALEEDSMKRDYLDFMYQYNRYTAKYAKLDKIKEEEEKLQQSKSTKTNLMNINNNSNTNNNNKNGTNTPVTPSGGNDLSVTRPGPITNAQLQESQDEENAIKNIELTRIKKDFQLKKWLDKYKKVELSRMDRFKRIFKKNHWVKNTNFRLPMNRWSWQEVVSFIEDNEELKHFSSIFYEYQINGQELVAMNGDLIGLLIEVALTKNYNSSFEERFDDFRDVFNKNKDTDGRIQKELAEEIQRLVRHIQRGRIQSHIVSRYYLIWEILRRKREKNATAQTIYDILGYLKPHLSAGPKQFWKMQAHFYCKIDNFLAVLVADPDLRQLYRKLYPKFLKDNEDEEDEEEQRIQPKPDNPRLQMKRATATQLRVVQTGPRNWRLKSVDPATNKSQFMDTIDLYGASEALVGGAGANVYGGGLGDRSFSRISNKPKHGNQDTVDTWNHTHKRSVDSLFGKSNTFRGLNTQSNAPPKKKKRYDIFDRMADACCNKKGNMNQYIHAIPRVYLKALIMVLFACIFGCLFTTLWYYNAAITATDLAMKLTIESIGEREVNFINYQLFAPQSLQSIGFGEIQIQSDILDIEGINDTLIRDSWVDDASLDFLLVEWSFYSNTPHIANFFLYNNNTNTLIGGYKANDDESLIISVYNGTCRREWYYNETTQTRDWKREIVDNFDCDYKPRSRPWYTELMEIGGIDNSLWTKPYWFQEGAFGMTLSTAIENKGVVYLFLNELTVDSISNFYGDDRLLLPQDTIVMFVTPTLDVLLSSIGQIDLKDIDDCQGVQCKATNDMIVQSMRDLRSYQDQIDKDINESSEGYVERFVDDKYWVNIFQYDALYMNELLFDREPEKGYIVITYDEVHWEEIDDAFIISWIISGLMLLFGTCLVCCNIKFHRQQFFERQLSKSLEQGPDVAGANGAANMDGFKGDYDDTNDNNPYYKKSPSTIEEQKEEEDGFQDNDENEQDKEEPVAKTKTEMEMAVLNEDLNFQTTNLDEDEEEKEITPQPADAEELQQDEAGALTLSVNMHLEPDPNRDPNSSSDNNDAITTPQSPNDKLKQMSIDTATTDGSGRMSIGNHQNDPLLQNTVALKDGDGDKDGNGNVKVPKTPSSLGTTSPGVSMSNLRSKNNVESRTDTLLNAVSMRKVITDPKWCQLSQPVLLIVLFAFMTFTFILLGATWTANAGGAMDVLLDDVMAPQEWSVVRDKVFQLIDSSSSIKQIVENRLNDDNAVGYFNEPELDRIWTNIMKSFVNSNNLYNQHFVFVGTPDGTFRGAKRKGPDEIDLYIAARDSDNEYVYYTWPSDQDNTKRDDSGDPISINYLYDPRCRPWYTNAIERRFQGKLEQAFPNNTWPAFAEDDVYNLARQTPACVDAVEVYKQLWNVTANDTTSKNTINADYDVSDYLVWSTYVFASLNSIGLTASTVITDRETGELLGVVGIDYTLDSISQILNESIGDEHEDDNWYSWIINADYGDPFYLNMIASSDFQVLTTTEEIVGCLQLSEEEEKIPYLAAEHPDAFIRIVSQEVISHYGIPNDTSLTENINFTINATTPFELEVPIDYPIAQGGRITYYPDDSGLDWMVMKLVDVTDITGIENDALKTTGIVLILVLIVSFICFKEITLQYVAGYDEEEERGDDLEQDYLSDMFKMKKIVEGAANNVWLEKVGDTGDDLMTTEVANDFLADRANQFITAENDRNQVFISCVLEYLHKVPTSREPTTNWKDKFMHFMFSQKYSIPCQLVILAHIGITFYEPANLTLLAMHGLSGKLIFANAVCVFLEFIFCIFLNTLHRVILFSIKREHLETIYELYYGRHHVWTKKVRNKQRGQLYLIALGPHCGRFILRIIIWFIILIDFFLRVFNNKNQWSGLFSYRVPMLPILFLVENRYVWTFFWEFCYAIKYAGDVLASYIAFIIVFAITAMSLFGSTDINQEDKTVDSFDSITRSFITAFVYISTSENYDAVVAETFVDTNEDGGDDDEPIPTMIVVNAMAVCLIFVVLGLFTFIPMIIHRFEEAFSKSRDRKDEIAKYTKSESLIAAFIMLDMDGNLEIDRNEFQQLVTHSILINKNKLFDIFNDDGDEVIDINEFVSALSKQEFRSKMLYHGEQTQNKLQAWLECNVFRRYRNRLVTFLCVVLPVFGMALLRGLEEIDESTVDTLVFVFYALNSVDIGLRWFAFGPYRFFDLARYPNPPFTTAAINKYNSKRKIPFLNDDDSDKIIRLSASEREWVVKYLRDTRPQSLLERSVLSICHRIEAFFMISMAILWVISFALFRDLDQEYLAGYQRHVLELALFIRFFTCLRSNQKLVYVIFTVFPQFSALLTFLALFIYGWARLGCTLFGDGTRDIITEEVYPQSSNITTNFETLTFSMLSLMQLMIGEGWHEIMYYNVMSTSLIFSSYFMAYVFIVTIIITNVFVGLFLSDIDQLKTKQEDEDTLSIFLKKSSKFRKYAKAKLNELHYDLQQIEDRKKEKLKQIDTFKRLLYQGDSLGGQSMLNQSLLNLGKDYDDRFTI